MANDETPFFRAVEGDPHALAYVVRTKNANLLLAVAAFLAVDSRPSPLAIVTVRLADLRWGMRLPLDAETASAALRLLASNPGADLLHALKEAGASSESWLHVIKCADLADPDVSSAVLRIMVANDLSFIPKESVRRAWANAPRTMRAAVIEQWRATPKQIRRFGIDLWSVMDEQEKIAVASIAASDEQTAEFLLLFLRDEWECSPPRARHALLMAVPPTAFCAAAGRIWSKLADEERNAVLDRVAGHAELAANLISSMNAEGWKAMSPPARRMLLDAAAATPSVRRALLDAVTRVPDRTKIAAETFWDVMNDEERTAVALLAASSDAQDAARLAQVMQADGWACAPSSPRRALVQALASMPNHAPAAAAAVWQGATEDERNAFVAMVAHDPHLSADLIEGVADSGWKETPPSAQTMLIESARRQAKSAARACVALWTALSDRMRNTLARDSARSSAAAAALLAAVTSEGWNLLDRPIQQRLLNALLRRKTDFCASGLASVWDGLAEDDRSTIIAHIAQGNVNGRAFLEHLSTEAWDRTSLAERESLLHAVHASDIIDFAVARWDALTDRERDIIVTHVQPSSYDAFMFLRLLPLQKYEAIPDSARVHLIASALRHGEDAFRACGEKWHVLNDADRARVIAATELQSAYVRALVRSLPAGAWATLAERDRRRLLTSLINEKDALTSCINAIWADMTMDERMQVVRAVRACADERMLWLVENIGAAGWNLMPLEGQEACVETLASSAYLAARALLVIGRNICNRRGARLCHAVIPRDAATQMQIAHGLAQGEPWRSWKAWYAPDVDDPADVRAAWRSVAHAIPMTIALRLLRRRKTLHRSG